MKILFVLSCLLTTLLLANTQLQAAEPGLQPWPQNPWYWSYHGKPILLLGGSDDDNLFQWPEDKLRAQLDTLAAAGGNIIRNTMSDRKDLGFEVYPFKQLENGKYDLNEWNPEYWSRFERLLQETKKRGIIVQIEIWDRFDFTDFAGRNRWRIHPYNPKNNVNYSVQQSGFAEQAPDHPGMNRHPFFFTTPHQRNNRAVLPYQQRFVDKLLDHTLACDHVLYCMDNETSAEEEWGRYWAEYVKLRARKEGRQIFVTEMWDDWNLASSLHLRTLDHPERYDFVEASQNNHHRGRTHWDNFIRLRQYLTVSPRPINTIKTYGATGNSFGHTDQDGIERFWRHLLAGAAAIRFHRPDAGLGLTPKATAAIRAARKLESRIPLWSMQPANELLSGHEPGQAYLAANPGQSYALYVPAGGRVSIKTSASPAPVVVHWINIDSGEWGPEQNLPAQPQLLLTAPTNGNWAAAIIPQR